MRRSCLLIAFFYVNYAAWLGSVCVGSRLLHSDPTKNWVVLVAGSNGWGNYRHQADVFHAYQILRHNNISAEQIITFAYDDIANNSENPFMGKVFNDYYHIDVYEGVIIDYRGEDVTPQNFLRVLRGDKELEAAGKKVLKSGPEDHVFIYFSDHGGDGIISFPEDELSATDLNKTLGYMYKNGKYKKLVLYVEACESGSMFEGILPSNIGIYVTTAANNQEASWATFCHDEVIDTCLADEYSYNWLTDSEEHDLTHRTLDQQFKSVKRRTKRSHVSRFGEMDVGRLPVGDFQGHSEQSMLLDSATMTQVLHSRPSRWAHLTTISRRLVHAESVEEHELAARKLYRTLQLGHIVKQTFDDIVMDVTTFHQPTIHELSKSEELQCYEAVFKQFRKRCFTIRQVPEVAQYAGYLRKLCKKGYETKILIQSVHKVCS
ncbi:Hemoglobinase [Clonorchis sinensis]|uniref:Hemoglobinase n=2 Tax=Clonorchis sinensis TaxID=79923 RepID=A0A8T1MKT2_CLOSI|nr:Hemoglobinase [Clonorchis sinensis]